MAAILNARVLFAFLATVMFAIAASAKSPNWKVAITYQIQGDAAIKSIIESDTKDHVQDEKSVIVYPKKPRHMAWGFYSHYTVALCDCRNNDSPRQFRWQTEYCGAVNKSLTTGQTSFEFSFKELAADFSKAQCNFTLDEIEMMANSPYNSIFVEEVSEKGAARQGLGSFPILHTLTIADMRLEKCGQPEPICRYNIDFPQERRNIDVPQERSTGWMPQFSPPGFMTSLLAIITAFWVGTHLPRRQPAAKSNEPETVKSKGQEKAD